MSNKNNPEDMSNTCRFKYNEKWYQAHTIRSMTQEEWKDWYSKHCGKCKYMNEICMYYEDRAIEDSRREFNKDITRLIQKHNISEDYAGCYLCNFEDEYICRKYNGGCKSINKCRSIEESETKLKKEKIE